MSAGDGTVLACRLLTALMVDITLANSSQLLTLPPQASLSLSRIYGSTRQFLLRRHAHTLDLTGTLDNSTEPAGRFASPRKLCSLPLWH
jgi:hypothetical protein